MRTRSRGERGQTTVIGVVLVLALVIIGTTVIVVLAGQDITDTQQRAEVQSAEQSLTQFDSQASLVAHGEPTSQQVSIPTGDSGAVRVEPNAGNMTLYAENSAGTVVLDREIQLGALVYERGRTTIAYQGGGVWRRDGNGSVMVSPPEFDYNVRTGQTPTLTLPLVTIGSSDSVSGRFRIKQTGDTEAIFPNSTTENPLEDGVIVVTVESDYYLAWGSFFENRVEGTVSYDHPNQTATVELVVPRSIQLGEGIGSGAATLTLENGGFINSYDSRETAYSDPGEANAIVAVDGNIETTNSATVRGTVRSTGGADVNNNINVSGPFVVAGDSTISASPEFGDVYSTGGNLAIDGSKSEFRDDVIVGGAVTEVKNNKNSGINGTLYAGGNVTLNQTFIEGDVISDRNVVVKDNNNMEVKGTIFANGTVTIGKKATVHDINATGRVVLDGTTVKGDVRTTGEIEMTGGATIEGDAVAGGDPDGNGLAIEMDGGTIEGDAFGDEVDDEDGTVNGAVEEDPADIPSPAATVVTPTAPLNPGVSIPDDVNGIISGQDELVNDANNDNGAEDDIDEGNDEFASGSTYTIESGNYFLDSPSLTSSDSITFNTSGGDIAIYVDGTFSVDGTDVDVTGDGKVKLYMDDDLDWVGNTEMNTTGEAGNQFYVFMRPNGTADFDNKAIFKGAIYGPPSPTEDGTEITINNNVEIFGGVVGNVQATSNGNEVHYDEALNEKLLIGGASVPRVTFLHISTTEVTLED